MKQHETGVSVADLSREHNVSTALIYQWRSKFGGMDASMTKRLKALEAENALVADWLLKLTQTHKRWGFGLCFLYLRNVKGYSWNHKRVYRIYRELELNLRIKSRRRIKRDYPGELDVPTAPNQVWSMDFISDQLVSGKSIRTFNVIYGYNREGLVLK